MGLNSPGCPSSADPDLQEGGWIYHQIITFYQIPFYEDEKFCIFENFWWLFFGHSPLFSHFTFLGARGQTLFTKALGYLHWLAYTKFSSWLLLFYSHLLLYNQYFSAEGGKLYRQNWWGPWPVWYENLSGVVICPDKSRHKHRWSG